jgi:hypothetical protein
VRSGGIAVTGTATVSSHILTTSPSAADIGDATNFFQTVYAENGDFTAGSVANQYLKTRKLEIADIAGSAGFWDHRSQGSFVSNSSYTIRDNGGSRWLSASRAVSGSPTNTTSVYTNWVPALRAIADGDAVDDSTRPSLGASGSEWTNIYGTNIYGNLTASTTNTKKVQPDANVTWDLGDPARNYNALWVKAAEMASGGYIAPQTTNTSSIGRSGYPFNKGWFTDLDVTGTIRFPTGAVNGYCWKSDASGNGSWGTCSTGVTSIATSSPISGGTITTTGTISCPTCYTTSGGTMSGSVTPSPSATYNLGSSVSRWLGIHGTNVFAYGELNVQGATVTAPDGNSGISATVTVRNSAGTGTCTLVFSGGLLTGGTC